LRLAISENTLRNVVKTAQKPSVELQISCSIGRSYGTECSDPLLFGGWRCADSAAAALYSPSSSLNILAGL
jgi:hypothetical protein